MYNPFSLQGKIILVTGASSGIGRSVAIECSKMQAQLIITGRDKDRLNDTFNQLEGNNHQQVITDLSTDDGITLLTEIVPSLDGIVHAAGIAKPRPFQYINRQELDLIMNINFYAPVLLTNILLKKKLIKKNSSLVFISSISGTMCASTGSSAYSASKGALNGVIKGVAIEVAPKNIRVNTIIPGMINTGIFSESAISNEELEEDYKRYPLGRFGKPEEVAYAAIYLLSDAAGWTTGSNLLLDGGYTLI